MRIQYAFFLCILSAMLSGASADTVKFKDGTSWTGEIISQDSTQIVMSVELSGGKITTQRTADRSDVTEIILSTADEKFAKAAAEAHRQAIKYQLNPQYSYPADYYDKIIAGVFDKFLTTYSNSVYVSEIQSLRSQWSAERNQVVAGSAKFHGEWKPSNEVAALIDAEQSRKSMDAARSFMSQGKLDDAIRYLLPLTGTNHSQSVVSDATSLLTEVYKLLVPQLEQRLQQIQTESTRTKEAADKARLEVEKAQQAFSQAMQKGSQMGSWDSEGGTSTKRRNSFDSGANRRGTSSSAPTRRFGEQSEKLIAAQAAVNNEKQNYAAIERSYAQLQSEGQILQERLTAASSAMARLSISITTNEAQTVAQVISPAEDQPQSTPETPSTDRQEEENVATGIGAWLKKNWLFVLLGAGAVLYILNRFTKN